MRILLGVALAVASLLLNGWPAWAQVDCSVPDALCTGDPCVIPTVEVANPCIVDFGPRTVVVAGRLKVPTGGTLSLTAASITVDGRIRGKIVTNVTLVAAAGDVVLNGPISSPPLGFDGAGTIALQASGDIVTNAPIRVPGIYDSPTVTLEAGGDIMVGRGISWPSYLTLQAGGSIEIGARLRHGLLVVEADGLLVVDGALSGGQPVLRGAGGVEVRRTVISWGWPIEITSSGGGVTIDGKVSSSLGYPSAGDIVITAAGPVAINQNVAASSVASSIPTGQIAGTIRVVGSSVAVAPQVRLNADGSNDAGEIRLRATAGDLGLAGAFFARGGGGGIIEATATGDTTASGRFESGPGGCIALSAGATLDTSAGTFDSPVQLDCPGSPSGAFLD
jgi:hypothetical protein